MSSSDLVVVHFYFYEVKHSTRSPPPYLEYHQSLWGFPRGFGLLKPASTDQTLNFPQQSS